MKNIHKITHSNFLSNLTINTPDASEAASIIKKQLELSKVVKVTNCYHIQDLRNFYDTITDNLGKPVYIGEDYKKGGSNTGERWLEVRYDQDVPDMDAYRHSKNAQPLHTDESYISDPCDVLVFYCVNRAIKGGQTLFVDSYDLVERMKVVDPDLLDRLSNTNVTYSKAENSRCEKIIDLEDPTNPALNYNYYCISKDEPLESQKLNQEFLDFLNTHVRGSFIEHPVQLSPGESVFWWDHYLLHGRNPFEANKTNDRFIWKAGIKW